MMTVNEVSKLAGVSRCSNGTFATDFIIQRAGVPVKRN